MGRNLETPLGLGPSGASLWAAVTSEFALEEHEAVTLREACRTADRLDELDAEMATQPLTVINSKGDETANPRIVEQRQQALAYTRLMASLRLPDEEGAQPQTRGGARGTYGKLKSVG